MNTRILRMTRRGHLRGLRSVPSLGQLQPVTFSIGRDGGVVFRCEGIERGRACLRRYPLPYQRAAAKAAFAELERHKVEGTETPSARSWREY